MSQQATYTQLLPAGPAVARFNQHGQRAGYGLQQAHREAMPMCFNDLYACPAIHYKLMKLIYL